MTRPDRPALKHQLQQSIADLGSQIALLPTAEPSLKAPINQQIQTLVAQNPTPSPFSPDEIDRLLGTWELIYASQGTVVTRRLGQSQGREVKSLVTLRRIWQVLGAKSGDPAEKRYLGLEAENGARLQVPVVGEIQLRAQGLWAIDQGITQPTPSGHSLTEPDASRPELGPETTAQVTFRSFGLQGTALGPWQWQGPELFLPVLPLLQRSALWRVVYLDEDLYIGEGKTGNRFVFQRASA